MYFISLQKDASQHKAFYSFGSSLDHVEDGLQLDQQLPLLVGDVAAVELLQGVDTGTRDLADEGVRLLEMTAVRWLVAAHLDLDGHRRLALFADLDLLVLALDGGSGMS